jgi:hypothetical protein
MRRIQTRVRSCRDSIAKMRPGLQFVANDPTSQSRRTASAPSVFPVLGFGKLASLSRISPDMTPSSIQGRTGPISLASRPEALLELENR